MDVGEWTGLAGLILGLGAVAINIGVTKAKILGSERRLDQLEKTRDRMGAQLHKAAGDIRALATVVSERMHRRSATLSNLVGGGVAES